MPRPDITYRLHEEPGSSVLREIQSGFIGVLQLFIVSNRHSACDAANNNARHFAFNADELLSNARLFAGETELSLVA